MPSYWFPQKPSFTAADCLADRAKIAAELEAPIQVIPVEDVDENLVGPPVVVVQNLRKTFGSYRAVNDLSFKMYENQIFALLGHNGAGKVSIFTSLFLV
jgi:ATPase subunit of ABC transporter with duplicated ATPase domains